MVDFFNNPIASLVFSVIAVALTSFIAQHNWSAQAKGALAFGLSVVLGLVQYALQGQVDLNHLDKLAVDFGAILVLGQGIYRTVFKGTALEDTLLSVGSKS
jgi:predicted exporter